MPSVTLAEVDTAIFNRLGGVVAGNSFTVGLFTVGGVNPEFFIGPDNYTDDPETETRRFPSISWDLVTIEEDGDRLDGHYDVVVSEDLLSSPPTRTVKTAPQPYLLAYVMHLHARKKADTREFIDHILAYFPLRDKLTIDSERDLYMFRSPSIINAPTVEGDQLVHQVDINFSIYAEMSQSVTEDIVLVDQVRTNIYNGLDTSSVARGIIVNSVGYTMSDSEV